MKTNELIKHHRQRLSLSQEQLGELLGVKRGAVNKWESGLVKTIKRPTIDTLSALFGISPSELMGFEDSNRNPQDGNYFTLTIKDKSMEPDMMKGDIVVVREQPTVINNEMAVVSVDGKDATVKQVKIENNSIMLIPLNRDFHPIYFKTEDLLNKNLVIIGKVVELKRIYK